MPKKASPAWTWEPRIATEFRNRVLTSAHVAVCVLDSAGRFVSISPRGAEVTGYSIDELTGKHCTEVLAPEDQLPVGNLIESVLTHGTTLPETEANILCKDGTRKILSFEIAPLRAGKKITGAVAAGEDITTTRRAEESVRRSERELRLLSSRLLDLQDAERRRIARELHDVTAQNLFAIHIALSRLQQQLPEGPRATVQECVSLCEQSREEIRTLSYLLHPPMLDEAGLIAALRWYIDGFSKRTGIKVSLDVDHDIGRLSIDLETDLFRVVQECLANVHRHSGGRTASVKLNRDGERIVLRVQDSGHGMSAEVRGESKLASLGVGIPGMRERLGQHKGQLEVKTGRNGTRVTATIPLGNRAAGAQTLL